MYPFSLCGTNPARAAPATSDGTNPTPCTAPPWAGTELGGAGALCHIHVTVPTAPVSWLTGILAQLQPIIISSIKVPVKCKQELVAFTPGGKTLQPVLDAALDLLGWDMWGVR